LSSALLSVAELVFVYTDPEYALNPILHSSSRAKGLRLTRQAMYV